MPRIGICPSTLVADPLDCTPAELHGALDACVAAGFESVSWWAMHHAILGADATAAIGSRHLAVGALEVAMSWPTGDEGRIARELADLAPLVDAFSPEVVVGVCLDAAIDEAAATSGLAQLTEWSHQRDLRVAVEFLPWTAVASIHDAHRLTTAVDHAACGILLDTWHWARQPTGAGLDQLADVDLGRVHCVQLDDAPAEPIGDDLFAETMSHRMVPGDGDVDLVGLLDAVRAAGADPYIAPEVFNTELQASGPGPMAARIAEGVDRTLRAVGWA